MRANTIAVSILAVAAIGAILVAQDRPAQPGLPVTPPTPLQETKAAPTKDASVTVEGCLHGSNLEPTGDDPILFTYGETEYELDMSKAWRERLLGHQGHAERVTGTLMLPADNDRNVVTKPIGSKTDVIAGRSDRRASYSGVPIIAVKSVTHLADTCAAMIKPDPSVYR